MTQGLKYPSAVSRAAPLHIVSLIPSLPALLRKCIQIPKKKHINTAASFSIKLSRQLSIF